MPGYEFLHNGRAFTPNGDTPVQHTQAEVDACNKETERQEIEWLKTGPDRVFLYVRVAKFHPNGCGISGQGWAVTTWLGTVVTNGRDIKVGLSVPVGGIAGRWAHKRSVDCRIFGVRYVGWYYESSGDYCRLRKAKRQ